MKTFTIDRAKWCRGEYRYVNDETGDSSLLRTDGMRCCLGFLGAACKIPDKKLLGKPWPSDVLGKWPKGLTDDAEGKICTVNDSLGWTERTREKQLTKLFAEIGVKVRFKGRSPRRKK